MLPSLKSYDAIRDAIRKRALFASTSEQLLLSIALRHVEKAADIAKARALVAEVLP